MEGPPIVSAQVVPGQVVPGQVVVQQQPQVVQGQVLQQQPMVVQQPMMMAKPGQVAPVQQPMMVVQQPMVPQSNYWQGGELCACTAPPGGCNLCLAAWCCPCIVVGQLHDRVVRPGSCSSVAWPLAAMMIVKQIIDISVRAATGIDISPLTSLFTAIVFLHYMTKIRKAIVARDGITDAPNKECSNCSIECENFCCWPCVTCWMFRHDLLTRSPGQDYSDCCSPTGTPYASVHVV